MPWKNAEFDFHGVELFRSRRKTTTPPAGGGKEGIGTKNGCMVIIMPCTAKKYEIGRDEYMSSTGTQDTDKVLTTRELARMIQSVDIDFNGGGSSVSVKRTKGLYTDDERSPSACRT